LTPAVFALGSLSRTFGRIMLLVGRGWEFLSTVLFSSEEKNVTRDDDDRKTRFDKSYDYEMDRRAEVSSFFFRSSHHGDSPSDLRLADVHSL